eukprot:2962697-Rhodomonas_salina.4
MACGVVADEEEEEEGGKATGPKVVRQVPKLFYPPTLVLYWRGAILELRTRRGRVLVLTGGTVGGTREWRPPWIL